MLPAHRTAGMIVVAVVLHVNFVVKADDKDSSVGVLSTSEQSPRLKDLQRRICEQGAPTSRPRFRQLASTTTAFLSLSHQVVITGASSAPGMA